MRNIVGGIEIGEGAGREVEDPATLEIIDSVDVFTSNQIDLAVKAARAAFPKWAASSDARRRVLAACSAVLTMHEDELALLLSREQGKPLAQAYSELRGSQKILDWYAGVEDSEVVLRKTSTSGSSRATFRSESSR